MRRIPTTHLGVFSDPKIQIPPSIMYELTDSVWSVPLILTGRELQLDRSRVRRLIIMAPYHMGSLHCELAPIKPDISQMLFGGDSYTVPTLLTSSGWVDLLARCISLHGIQREEALSLVEAFFTLATAINNNSIWMEGERVTLNHASSVHIITNTHKAVITA